MNIKATVRQLLELDNFNKLSIEERTQMITTKIVDIRDEYRQVMALLKSQHNFEYD